MVSSHLYSVASPWDEASDSVYIVGVNIRYKITTPITGVRAGSIYQRISCDLNIPVCAKNTPPGCVECSGVDDSGH